MSFLDSLKTRASEQRAALDREQAALAKLVEAERKADDRYAELCALRVESMPHPDAGEAHDALVAVREQRQRKQDMVREWQREVAGLEGRAQAPQRLQQARDDLAAARAAVAAVVAQRDAHTTRLQRLQAQLAAEREAEGRAREWARAELLARIEGGDVPGDRPPLPPGAHQDAAALLGLMIEDEQRAIGALDAEIAELRTSERQAEVAVLESAVGVRELELGEAMTAFGPAWSRYCAAYRAAYGLGDPALPDLAALAHVDEDEADADARAVLLPVEGGMVKRLMRKAAELVA